MARCKKCLHYEVCAKEGRLVQVDEHTWDEYNKLDDVEQFCTSYFNVDVVPKSEVEKDFEELLERCYNAEENADELLAETGSVYWEGYMKSAQDAWKCVLELKKKYTESEE